MARPNAQQRQINALLAKLEPAVQEAFNVAIQAARRQVNVTALIEALDRGDLGAAVRLLQLPQGVLFPLEDAIRAAYVEGGKMVAIAAPSALIGFNGSTPGAVAWLQELSSTRIQGIVDDTLEATRAALVAGRDQGMGSKAIARMITGTKQGTQRVGGILGLTTQQTDSIMGKYDDVGRLISMGGRQKLASGDPKLMREYLNLKLRDRRYDAQIKKAIAEGRAITGPQLDKILEAHKSKALAYRGKLIAKNETFSALEAGRMEAMGQALANPDVEGVSVRWQHNLSEFPREDHVAMSGTVIQLGEYFVFPDGARMKHPHDPAGGARHSVGCRCIAIYRVRMKV
jgi:hypothetical protein